MLLCLNAIYCWRCMGSAKAKYHVFCKFVCIIHHLREVLFENLGVRGRC